MSASVHTPTPLTAIVQRLVAVAMLALVTVASLPAATYNWSNNAGGSWSVGANWGGTAPTGADPSDVINFSVNMVGNMDYTTTNDIAGTFLLNTLGLTGTNPPTPHSAYTSVVNINGNPLQLTAGTAVLDLNAANQGFGRKMQYNVNLPVTFTGGFTISGNGNNSSYNFAAVTMPTSAATITTTGSARATLSASPTITNNLSFAGAGTGGITVTGTTTVANDVTVDVSGNSTPQLGSLAGSGNLTKTGSGLIGFSYNAALSGYTGDLQIDGGTVRIDHNSGGGGPSDRSLGAMTVLNGGTLQFRHTGAGHFNPTLSFTSPIDVTANGGTVDFSGTANAFNNTLSSPYLAGDLVVTGNTGQPNYNGAAYNFTVGPLELGADAAIVNATTTAPNSPHAVVLSPNVSGSTRTLALAKVGTGGGFSVTGATASSLDLGGLVVEADTTLALRNDGTTTYDPLGQIAANGGITTVYGTLSLGGYSFNRTFNTANVSFQPGSRLNLIQIGGGWDSTWNINGDLTVSAAGLTTLHYQPYRGYAGGLKVNAANTLTIGAGGIFSIAVYREDGGELTNSNMRFLDGATIVGYNATNYEGGLVRGSLGLTLGDGSPSTITVQGNHGTQVDTFNIGYAANTVDSGNVTMKYANTGAGAGDYFNVGWSNGGNIRAALVALPGTSGGTDLAPLAGSGGVAIVGPATGTVATVANAAVHSTTGTAGFYNAGGNNVRGALGPVVVDGGSLTLEAYGTVQASTLTVQGGGLLAGNGIVAAATTVAADGTVGPGTSVGVIEIAGDLALDGTYALEVDGDTADKLIVSGSVTLSGTLSASHLAPPDGTTLTIIDKLSAGAVSGTFAGLPEGAIVSIGSYGMQISYVGGDGNDVTLTCLPCDPVTDAFLDELCDDFAASPPTSVEAAEARARAVAESLTAAHGLCSNCVEEALSLLP